MVDYSLWEVIENGNAPPITKLVKGVETVIDPSTAEEKAQRRDNAELQFLLTTSELIVWSFMGCGEDKNFFSTSQDNVTLKIFFILFLINVILMLIS
ncbi:hypothetical protein Tco_1457500 [Tanacetum coccineum]